MRPKLKRRKMHPSQKINHSPSAMSPHPLTPIPNSHRSQRNRRPIVWKWPLILMNSYRKMPAVCMAASSTIRCIRIVQWSHLHRIRAKARAMHIQEKMASVRNGQANEQVSGLPCSSVKNQSKRKNSWAAFRHHTLQPTHLICKLQVKLYEQHTTAVHNK